MGIDRNRLEQEAVKLLQRGKTDQALQRYQTLVRDDPRDRRIRQKLAELYLQTGQNSQAEQHFRQLVKSFRRAGQEKRAMPLLRQLVKLKPEDAELQVDLGDLQIATGFPEQAKKTYEAVVERLERHHPDEAVPVVEKLIKLSPGSLPVQIKLAELFEASNWSQRACDEWHRLGREARRLGRTDDRSRFLEYALRLRPETLPILQEAAEARLALGEFENALGHLQAAYALDSSDPITLGLLARTLEALEQPVKARPIWLAAAAAHGAAGDALARLGALRKALEIEEDATLRAEVGEADQAAARFRLRLTDCSWAQPAAGAEEKLVYKATVQGRYGFVGRARKTLAERGSVAAKVALAEIIAASGDAEGALAVLADLSVESTEAQRDLELRRSVLEGREPDAEGSPVADEGMDDDELIDDFDDDDLIDDLDEDEEEDDLDDATDPGTPAPALAAADHEADGDAAFEQGAWDDALAAYRRGLMENPSSESLLMKLGEVMKSKLTPSPAPIPTEPTFDSSFASQGFGDSGEDAFSFLDDPAAPGGPPVALQPSPGPPDLGAGLGDAQALVAVGALDRAEMAVSGDESLGASVVRARVLRARADIPSATRLLRNAVGDASEDDAAYLPALLELAQLNAANGKVRAAKRLLDEVEDINPSYEATLVGRVRRGVSLLEQG